MHARMRTYDKAYWNAAVADRNSTLLRCTRAVSSRFQPFLIVLNRIFHKGCGSKVYSAVYLSYVHSGFRRERISKMRIGRSRQAEPLKEGRDGGYPDILGRQGMRAGIGWHTQPQRSFLAPQHPFYRSAIGVLSSELALRKWPHTFCLCLPPTLSEREKGGGPKIPHPLATHSII